MFLLNCKESGVTVESLETKNIREVEMFFSRNGYFSNLRNSIGVIRTLQKGESFKFHKNKNRNRYIEVEIL